jgi:glycosyltransferase involved in cell wall biosynthesis
MSNNAMITFIIPTIGRNTLVDTINSLLYQTNNLWKAIIIFDGIEPIYETNDDRIQILQCEKLGQGVNRAGLVRNYGMTFVDTEWVGFVDDDDTLSSNYVEHLLNETIKYDTDIIIFRMFNQENNIILPNLETDHFYEAQVGISFAIKKKVFDEGCQFIASGTEDFSYLENAQINGHKIMISPYITYFVRNSDYSICKTIGNRVFI